MAGYVTATVIGGMAGRLLGGWMHAWWDWRVAFLIAAMTLLLAALLIQPMLTTQQPASRVFAKQDGSDSAGYLGLLRDRRLQPFFVCAFSGQAIFSTVFNYTPYRLESAPFMLPTALSTAAYLVYVVGFLSGPLAGRLGDRLGGGMTLISGTVVLMLSLIGLTFDSLWMVFFSLAGVCGGFFVLHAAAIGAMNRKLEHHHGRANGLYVMFYYLGAAAGIAGSGVIFAVAGWVSMMLVGCLIACVILTVGLHERRTDRAQLMIQQHQESGL